MPVRQGQNQTILGCFVRTSRRTLCGKRRGRPLRVLAMAVFGALVFYFILFVHIPNNGLGDGNVNSFKNSHRDIFQVNNLALRNIDVLGRERDARGTDRHGRVLMKGQELQDDRNSDKNNDTLIAASYPSSLASNDSAQVDPSDMVIGGLNGEFSYLIKDCRTIITILTYIIGNRKFLIQGNLWCSSITSATTP